MFFQKQHVSSSGRAGRKAAGVVLALLAGSLTGVQSSLANGGFKGDGYSGDMGDKALKGKIDRC